MSCGTVPFIYPLHPAVFDISGFEFLMKFFGLLYAIDDQEHVVKPEAQVFFVGSDTLSDQIVDDLVLCPFSSSAVASFILFLRLVRTSSNCFRILPK